MSDFQNKIFVCSHCGMENSVEDTLAKAEYERARADIGKAALSILRI